MESEAEEAGGLIEMLKRAGEGQIRGVRPTVTFAKDEAEHRITPEESQDSRQRISYRIR